MDALASVATMALSPGDSPFVYATITEYDPETKLSTVEILGEETENVPKLEHVTFGGGWESISEGQVGPGDGHSITDIPPYEAYDLEIFGRADSVQNINMMINDVDSNYRSSIFYGTAATPATVTFGSGSAIYVGRWNTTSSVSVVNFRRLYNLSNQFFWEVLGRTSNNNAAGSPQTENAVVMTSGIYLTANQEITKMTFNAGSAGGDDFIDFGWRLWGRHAFTSPVGRQVLCIRDRQVPLTIIGVLSGSTV